MNPSVGIIDSSQLQSWFIEVWIESYQRDLSITPLHCSVYTVEKVNEEES
uniref:Uncharacterized protein n=1 Tax=Arion vulgaris TaxID=1028688 RepID=A0A0B6ZTQ9_9EUPU